MSNVCEELTPNNPLQWKMATTNTAILKRKTDPLHTSMVWSKHLICPKPPKIKSLLLRNNTDMIPPPPPPQSLTHTHFKGTQAHIFVIFKIGKHTDQSSWAQSPHTLCILKVRLLWQGIYRPLHTQSKALLVRFYRPLHTQSKALLVRFYRPLHTQSKALLVRFYRPLHTQSKALLVRFYRPLHTQSKALLVRFYRPLHTQSKAPLTRHLQTSAYSK